MTRRLFWMAIGAAVAMWLVQRLKQIKPAAPTRAARRLTSDVAAALTAGREAKRRTESDLWTRLGNDTASLAPNVIEVPEEPFAPLRNALGKPQNRR